MKLKVLLVITLVILTFAGTASAEAKAKNNIYLEGGGPGGFYSVNYERRFSDLHFRIGGGHISTSDYTITTVPIGLNWIGVGGSHNHLELGGGLTVAILNGDSYLGDAAGAFGWGIIGYRHQPPNGGLNFRVGAMPLVGEFGLLPYGYLSLGVTF